MFETYYRAHKLLSHHHLTSQFTLVVKWSSRQMIQLGRVLLINGTSWSFIGLLIADSSSFHAFYSTLHLFWQHLWSTINMHRADNTIFQYWFDPEYNTHRWTWLQQYKASDNRTKLQTMQANRILESEMQMITPNDCQKFYLDSEIKITRELLLISPDTTYKGNRTHSTFTGPEHQSCMLNQQSVGCSHLQHQGDSTQHRQFSANHELWSFVPNKSPD
jgi:hypothetical protein